MSTDTQVFSYEAIAANGRRQRGKVEARGRTEAIRLLREQEITPLTVRSAPRNFEITLFGARVDRHELVLLTRQMATLIQSGVTIINALDLLSEQAESAPIASALREAREAVEGGSSLSDALMRSPRVFSTIYIATVRAGEESGTLDVALDDLARTLERDQRTRRQVASASRYPMVIGFVAAAAVLVMLLFVVPQFVSIFENLGAELPLPTQILLGLSGTLVPTQGYLIPTWPALMLLFGFLATMNARALLRQGRSIRRVVASVAIVITPLMVFAWGVISKPAWITAEWLQALPGGQWASDRLVAADIPPGFVEISTGLAIVMRVGLLLLGAYLLFAAIRNWKSSPAGRRQWDSMRMRIPGKVGDLVRKIAMARMARTLSTLLGAGVPVLTTLDVARESVGNAVIADALVAVRAQVADGEGLSESLERTGVFPPMVYRMAQVGEETGSLDEMLGRIAAYYEEEVDISLKNLQSVLEPIMIVAIAVIVGGILLALYLPTFSVYDAIGTQ